MKPGLYDMPMFCFLYLYQFYISVNFFQTLKSIVHPKIKQTATTTKKNIETFLLLCSTEENRKGLQREGE